jgi:hypothetical protein
MPLPWSVVISPRISLNVHHVENVSFRSKVGVTIDHFAAKLRTLGNFSGDFQQQIPSKLFLWCQRLNVRTDIISYALILCTLCGNNAADWNLIVFITAEVFDGGSTDLRNVGKFTPVYSASQPRGQPSLAKLYFMVFGLWRRLVW